MNISKIAFLLPTYKGDLQYCKRLIQSYEKHNKDSIPLYIVLPSKDVELFKEFKLVHTYTQHQQYRNISIVFEEDLLKDSLVKDNSVLGIRPGYINQELIKLSFYKLGLCENYLCLDSDGMFIRDFYVSDFMFDENTPYTTLIEDHELAVEPKYYKQYWIGREPSIKRIQRTLGLQDSRQLTCHGFAILNGKVLAGFEKWCTDNSMTFTDCLKISPYEFSWYNMYLQKTKMIPLEVKEPLFKYFHHKGHHLEYVQKGVTISDIARGYVGLVINSNYSREYGMVSYDETYKYNIFFKIINKIEQIYE